MTSKIEQMRESSNALIDARDQQRCVRCGRVIRGFGSRHHRKFRSRGGGDEVSNRVLLCGSGTTGCHGLVHANPKDARVLGLAVASWEDSRLIPIRHALYGDVWLDDRGGFSRVSPAEEVS